MTVTQARLWHRSLRARRACLPGCDRVLRLASRRSSFPSMGDYVQKNRPNWRFRLGSGREKGCSAVFPGYRSKFGDGHPSRKQCIAKARSTGQRCRHDAVHGASCCHVHGGHRWGLLAEQKRLGFGRVISPAACRSVPRKALAAIGSGETPRDLPRSIPLPVSPVERGRLYEAWLNRRLAPGVWLAITKKLGG